MCMHICISVLRVFCHFVIGHGGLPLAERTAFGEEEKGWEERECWLFFISRAVFFFFLVADGVAFSKRYPRDEAVISGAWKKKNKKYNPDCWSCRDGLSRGSAKKKKKKVLFFFFA